MGWALWPAGGRDTGAGCVSVVTQDHDNSLCAFGECKQEREKEVEEVKKRKIVAGKGGWGKESPPLQVPPTLAVWYPALPLPALPASVHTHQRRLVPPGFS